MTVVYKVYIFVYNYTNILTVYRTYINFIKVVYTVYIFVYNYIVI